MSNPNAITSVHVQKLGHKLEEIRCRSLENIISKLDHGFGCSCDAVKRELLNKLFTWFTFETVPHTEKVLNLINRLIHQNFINLESFGKQRFQNEVDILRTKLDCLWHDKLDEIEESAINQSPKISNEYKKCPQIVVYSPQNSQDVQEIPQEYHGLSEAPEIQDHHEQSEDNPEFTLNLEDSLTSEPGTPVSKRTEDAIKWLVMPWQPLVTSDIGVLTAVEEALTNQTDNNSIIHTCKLITNVMLQDFPAEVFLQRPTIVKILQKFIESNEKKTNNELMSAVLRGFLKLTRSLRFRIYYYCEPSIANKRQRVLIGLFDNNFCQSSSDNNSNRSQNFDNSDDSILQLQQMLLPDYCIVTMMDILRLLDHHDDDNRPLKDVKIIMDVLFELVGLLNIILLPSIWLCSDELSIKIQQDLKNLMTLFGDVLQVFRNISTIDFYKITYLYILKIIIKFLSLLVPLEISDLIIPDKLKIELTLSLFDGTIYLNYPQFNLNIYEYVSKLSGNNEIELLNNYDNLKMIIKSMKSAVLVLKLEDTDVVQADVLKIMYNSKLSLCYHKNMGIIKKYFQLFRHFNYDKASQNDINLINKLLLYLLANSDDDIRLSTYKECHWIVKDVLGLEVSRGKNSWKTLEFLFNSKIFIEFICHGVNDAKNISTLAEDILILLLKGKLQLGDNGWNKFLNSLLPVLPLLQCLGSTKTIIGKCILKIFDPDISEEINIPFLELLKCNIRFLFSSDEQTRDEAIYRLIYLLGLDKNSANKLPKLSSLHGLPLSSILINENLIFFRKSEGNYQESNLLSVLEMLKINEIESSVRKTAIIQMNVMLTDTKLHKLFLSQNGLALILSIFDKCLIENDYDYNPESLIPILSIIKLLLSSTNIIRHDLSKRVDIFFNILRTIFLFPSNESVKNEGGQILFILLFNEFMMKSGDNEKGSPSLPALIIEKMKTPFICKPHWKISVNKKSDTTILIKNNQILLTFIRQYWSWEWHAGEDVLWIDWNTINNQDISTDLMINQDEFINLQLSSIGYCSQRQLSNIQNSETHLEVINALDYLWMYTKLADLLKSNTTMSIFEKLKWENTFERFLLSHPTSKEDCELFVDVLGYLNILINVTKDHRVIKWLSKMMKNMTKSLSDLLRSMDKNYQNIHHSVLKLVRSCSSLEKKSSTEDDDDDEDCWSDFIELVIQNLSPGDQQHFYNLVYLDWLLTSLTYLTSNCKWKSKKNNLIDLSNSLIELIMSFHGNGAFSFMGLSITKNSIICLNHVLQHVSCNFFDLSKFWYDDGRTLTWLPTLWRSRDPLVRASGLQFLAGLIKAQHTGEQLFHGLALAPSELCHVLIKLLINRDEAAVVKEQACLALANIIKNSINDHLKYTDTLTSSTILLYIEQNNVYYEISIILANIFLPNYLGDSTERVKILDTFDKSSSTGKSYSTCSTSKIYSFTTKSVLQFYHCFDELSDKINNDDMFPQLLSTPSFVTSICYLLNNLIIAGERDIVDKIYENSLDKYFTGCIIDLKKVIQARSTTASIDDIIEMFIGVLSVLTNCVTYCEEFASIVTFSPDFFYQIFGFLNDQVLSNIDCYFTEKLRVKLKIEVFNFISVMSLTENQHIDAIKSGIELVGCDVIVKSITMSILNSDDNLKMSCIACLGFLLSHEISVDKKKIIKQDYLSIGKLLDDTIILHDCLENNGDNLRDVLVNANKLTIGNNEIVNNDEFHCNKETSAAGCICKMLIHLLIAHNYAKSKKNKKIQRDKDLIISCLSNLLCVSIEAKKNSIVNNLPDTCLLIFKELFTELSLQPYQRFNSTCDKKLNPMTNELRKLFNLLMNFSSNSYDVKIIIAKIGIIDMMHKLWPWISLNDSTLVAALKFIATLTTNCPEAAQSLTLTTTLPGTGPRKTPNTVSLLNVIINLVIHEIDKSSQLFNNQKLHYSFHILRNSVHVHECRIVITKSNLLQFFTKIHPLTTKRIKPWPLIEIYCLEFLIDFTYYDEGQLIVPKIIDGFDVLIELSKCTTLTTKLLSLSILRNLVFNVTNRPRILGSIDFMNVLRDILKNGSHAEIGIVGSILWSLIANNHKGKLIIKSAGFLQYIKEALGRLTLKKEQNQSHELGKMLQYVISILSNSEANDAD